MSFWQFNTLFLCELSVVFWYDLKDNANGKMTGNINATLLERKKDFKIELFWFLKEKDEIQMNMTTSTLWQRYPVLFAG